MEFIYKHKFGFTLGLLIAYITCLFLSFVGACIEKQTFDLFTFNMLWVSLALFIGMYAIKNEKVKKWCTVGFPFVIFFATLFHASSFKVVSSGFSINACLGLAYMFQYIGILIGLFFIIIFVLRNVFHINFPVTILWVCGWVYLACLAFFGLFDMIGCGIAHAFKWPLVFYFLGGIVFGLYFMFNFDTFFPRFEGKIEETKPVEEPIIEPSKEPEVVEAEVKEPEDKEENSSETK